MRRPALAVPLRLATLPRLAPRPAAGENPIAVKLDGILRGTVFSPDGYFKWKSTEQPWGTLGTLTGSTKEFEEKTIEVGADRTLLTAPIRLAYETSRIRFEKERGEDTKVEIKGDVAISRTHRFSSDTVYMTACKMIGRTPLWARGDCGLKEQAGLTRVLLSVVATAKGAPDEVDGWIPADVKVEWQKTPASDLLVLDDGKVAKEFVGDAMRIVRQAHEFVRVALGGGAWVVPYAPVMRCVQSRDLFQHLAGRRGTGEVDAVHVSEVGELLLSPRAKAIDARSIARAAARQAYQLATGVADAEPLATGLARLADAIAAGAAAGSLTPSDEGRAYDLVQSKGIRTWATMLREGGFMSWGREPDELKGLEAELAAGYLVGSGGAQAKPSLTGWVAGLKKFGHVEAASGEAYKPLVPPKSDAEYWDYWKKRVEAARKPDKPKGK